MKVFLSFFLTCFISNFVQAQIVLTEVMFDPTGPEASDEFIEILNIGDSPIDLNGFAVGDGDRVESIIFPNDDTVLAPNQYAVIFDSDYFTSDRNYDELIPAAALVLSVDDKTLGSAGLSNSRAETVILLDVQGDTLGSYVYSLGNPAGFSDEKIEPEDGDDLSNWADSISQLGTPGAKNSVSPKQFDLAVALSESGITPPIPRSGQNVELRFVVENRGEADAAQSIFSLTAGDTQRVFTETISPLSVQGRFELATFWTPERPGVHEFQAKISLPGDEDKSNDALEFAVPVAWPEQSLLINEIMYNPGTGEPEWVEVLNPGAEAIILNEWRVQDASGKTGIVRVDDSLAIAPGGYAVFTSDLLVRELYSIAVEIPVVPLVGFPTLNNTNDEILLKDFTGSQIDSTLYPQIGTAEKGVSLERIWDTESSLSPTNWAASNDPAGATPGRMNSVSPVSFDLGIDALSLTFAPERPIRGDELFLTFNIENRGRENASLEAVRLFHDLDFDQRFSNEERVAEWPVAEILLPQSKQVESLSWMLEQSGLNRFQLEIEAGSDQRLADNVHAFEIPVGFLENDLIINEIMASPAENEPEWIEIINCSQQSFDLLGWRIGDGVSVSEPVLDRVIVEPGALITLAQSELTQVSDEIVLSKFPSLNNSGEVVRLLDLQNNVIDSVAYSETTTGVSIERINPKLPSDDSANWRMSVAPTGSTPGEQNSIFVDVLPVKSALTASPNPFSPDNDGIEDVTVISFELPLVESQVNLRIFDLYGREVRRLLNNAPAAATRQVVWDGRTDDGGILKMGIYVVLLEAINAGQGRLEKAKTTVVVAKKL